MLLNSTSSIPSITYTHMGLPKCVQCHYLVGTLAQTHQEVVRLDVSMDEALGVDILDAGQLQGHTGRFVS